MKLSPGAEWYKRMAEKNEKEKIRDILRKAKQGNELLVNYIYKKGLFDKYAYNR